MKSTKVSPCLKASSPHVVASVQEEVRQSRSGLTWQQGCCLRGLKAWSCPLGSTISGHLVKEKGLNRGKHPIWISIRDWHSTASPMFGDVALFTSSTHVFSRRLAALFHGKTS